MERAGGGDNPATARRRRFPSGVASLLCLRLGISAPTLSRRVATGDDHTALTAVAIYDEMEAAERAQVTLRYQRLRTDVVMSLARAWRPHALDERFLHDVLDAHFSPVMSEDVTP